MAHHCAKRFVGRGLSYDDLVREATVSLVAAAARYDPERGTAFSTFAVPSVLSDLRRACEKASPMHIPRGDRAVLIKAAALRQEQLQRTGQEPTVEALAGTLQVPAAELSAAMAADRQMQDMAYQPTEAQAQAAVDDKAERFVDYLLLLDVIARLPEPLPRLIRLRFLDCHTQQRTAQLMALSQGQISRLEIKARAALKAALTAS